MYLSRVQATDMPISTSQTHTVARDINNCQQSITQHSIRCIRNCNLITRLCRQSNCKKKKKHTFLQSEEMDDFKTFRYNFNYHVSNRGHLKMVLQDRNMSDDFLSTFNITLLHLMIVLFLNTSSLRNFRNFSIISFLVCPRTLHST